MRVRSVVVLVVLLAALALVAIALASRYGWLGAAR
jgi:hypothetical protein